VRRRLWLGLVALAGLVIKELRLMRDPRMLALLVVAPVFQLVVFTYAANLDVATARVVVLDHDRTPASRALATELTAIPDLELVAWTYDEDEAEKALALGNAELVLVIERGLGRKLARGEVGRVQILVDGVSTVAASTALSAAVGQLQSMGLELAAAPAESYGRRPEGPLLLRSRPLFNPALRSRLYMVPGVLVLVLMIVALVASSISLVQEKELGTLEQVIATPVSRGILIAGKLVPFMAIGFVDSLLVLAVARFWFEVPIRGDLWLLLAAIVPFQLSMLGLGLLVSIVSRTQQQAMLTATFFLMMPMIYFSGFVFPIQSMAAIFRALTEAIPLRHFLEIVRAVMLKGASPDEVRAPLIKLVAEGAFLFALSVALFRKRLA
jgi:ABC-2 type transport system permease protein